MPFLSTARGKWFSANTETSEMNYHYKLGTCCKRTQEQPSF